MADNLAKVVARNITDGPKTLNASPAITLHAGQATESEINISEAELEMAKLTEWFEFGSSKNQKVVKA